MLLTDGAFGVADINERVPGWFLACQSFNVLDLLVLCVPVSISFVTGVGEG